MNTGMADVGGTMIPFNMDVVGDLESLQSEVESYV
jgi:hypothetical protein